MSRRYEQSSVRMCSPMKLKFRGWILFRRAAVHESYPPHILVFYWPHVYHVNAEKKRNKIEFRINKIVKYWPIKMFAIPIYKIIFFSSKPLRICLLFEVFQIFSNSWTGWTRNHTKNYLQSIFSCFLRISRVRKQTQIATVVEILAHHGPMGDKIFICFFSKFCKEKNQ